MDQGVIWLAISISWKFKIFHSLHWRSLSTREMILIAQRMDGQGMRCWIHWKPEDSGLSLELPHLCWILNTFSISPGYIWHRSKVLKEACKGKIKNNHHYPQFWTDDDFFGRYWINTKWRLASRYQCLWNIHPNVRLILTLMISPFFFIQCWV